MKIKLFYVTYNCFLAIIAPFYLYKLLKPKANKPRIGKRWKEYFGYSESLQQSGNITWIHAVSVGEVIAIEPLIKQIKKSKPDTTLLMTTTTSTGANEVNKRLAELVEHRYMPIDFKFFINNFISRFSPDELIIMELELWPNLFKVLGNNNIDIKIVNARLSDKSLRNYQKIKSIVESLIGQIKNIICQSERDKTNFIALGAKQSQVCVSGNLKYDISIPSQQVQQGKNLKHAFQKQVIVACSTHSNEEQQIIESLTRSELLNEGTMLIIVPRHPERFNEVYRLSTYNYQLNTMKMTDIDLSNPPTDTQVLVGNTMGQMFMYLSMADVCIMGGSFIGEKVGGHNVIEPAALALPIISGQSYYNFLEVTQQLLIANAITIVRPNDELAHIVFELLHDRKTASTMSSNALKVYQENEGALEYTLSKCI
ncbi:3-deoxy-D-manno-octulosonic acid transferase [Vibrio sp. 10N.222.51.E8]|uniref:3-deoxy-D-manno-octulosonic acid transferase n=1 Tax=unclassified Vibrio TaxID=2614977 RepID=UPI001484FF36|nr:3-deoxy-D-manno-octulosonic acid transferase [Vibrio sp. F13]